MWLFQFLLALLKPIVVTPNRVTAAKNGLELVEKEMEMEIGKWNKGNGIEKRQGVFMPEIELGDRS